MKNTKSTQQFKLSFKELYSEAKYDCTVRAENWKEASGIALNELSKAVSKPYLFYEEFS